MKSAIIIGLLLLSSLCRAQDPKSDVIDQGYGILKIDEPLRNIKTYLKKDNVGNYLFEATEKESQLYQLYGEIDLNKAGLSKFLGFAVERCEVFFDVVYNEKGETEQEDIFGFTFYLKKSSGTKVVNELTKNMVDKYGEYEPFLHPDTGEVIRLDWFTEKTLIFVSLGVDSATGEEIDYYLIQFIQGYGG